MATPARFHVKSGQTNNYSKSKELLADNPLILAGIKPANNKLISPSPILLFIIEIFLIKIMLLLEVTLRCQFLSICPNRF